MIKNITRYSEFKDFLVCSFEILDIEEDKIDEAVKEIKELVSEKWIEWFVVVKQKIKFSLWINNKREFNKVRKNLLSILKNNGFKYGDETIFGDGTSTQNNR